MLPKKNQRLCFKNFPNNSVHGSYWPVKCSLAIFKVSSHYCFSQIFHLRGKLIGAEHHALTPLMLQLTHVTSDGWEAVHRWHQCLSPHQPLEYPCWQLGPITQLQCTQQLSWQYCNITTSARCCVGKNMRFHTCFITGSLLFWNNMFGSVWPGLLWKKLFTDYHSYIKC